MSDGEDSDIEIDEDASTHTSLPIDTKKHARAQHNALERRRRDNIKDMYGALKDAIPGMQNERASRAVILKRAVDMITTKQSIVEDMAAENARLEQENAELEEELFRLQNEAANLQTPVSYTAIVSERMDCQQVPVSVDSVAACQSVHEDQLISSEGFAAHFLSRRRLNIPYEGGVDTSGERK